MYTIRTHRLLHEKKQKNEPKNDGSHAVIVIIVGGKTPDNHQQASGTFWEIGGFGWGKKYVKNEGKKGQFGQIIVLKSQKKP